MLGSRRRMRLRDRRMHRYLLFVFVILFASVALICAAASPPAQSTNVLQRFYIVSHVVSDASPFWYNYVLDVKPTEKGALVQEIRIAPLNSYCTSPITVKAVERLLPSSSVKSVAKLPLCSLKEADFVSAIKAASQHGVGSIDDTVGFTIVAQCGTTGRFFDLPLVESIDLAWLKKNKPSVAALCDLSSNVTQRVFGKEFSFYGVSSDQDEAFQELGAKIVPDLKAGSYDQAFAANDPLSAAMDDYIGIATNQEPTHVELSDVLSLHFAKYKAPTFPPLAMQARIKGEVLLKITIDVLTGSVKDVIATSGHPLLQSTAIAAARQWQFQPDAQLPESIETRVKFELRCPSQ
jgi:TonB family protein